MFERKYNAVFILYWLGTRPFACWLASFLYGTVDTLWNTCLRSKLLYWENKKFKAGNILVGSCLNMVEV